jgi:hypothetical protein
MCYFQSPEDFEEDAGWRYGRASAEKTNWGSLDLNVFGDWASSDGDMSLVCRTSGTLENLTYTIVVSGGVLSGPLP